MCYSKTEWEGDLPKNGSGLRRLWFALYRRCLKGEVVDNKTDWLLTIYSGFRFRPDTADGGWEVGMNVDEMKDEEIQLVSYHVLKPCDSTLNLWHITSKCFIFNICSPILLVKVLK